MNTYYDAGEYRIKQGNTEVEADHPYFNEEASEGLYIVMKDGKHGIIHTDSKNIILPVEFDDVFCIWQNDIEGVKFEHFFRVHTGEKAGLLKVTLDYETKHINTEQIVKPECDSIAIFGVPSFIHLILLVSDKGRRYYNMDTGLMSDYYDAIYADEDALGNRLRAHRSGRHYLIDPYKDKVLFEIYTGNDYWSMSPIGSDNFINLDNKWLMVETKDGMKALTEYAVIAPLSIYPYPSMTHINIANVIKGTNGLGVLDSEGEALFNPAYDEISYEIKITAIKNGEKTEKFIPIAQINESNTLSNWLDKEENMNV